MALDNPAFSRNSAFSAQGAVAAAQDISAQQLQEMYNQPATPPAGETMAIDTTIQKSAVAFGLLLVGAAIGWVTMQSLPFLWIGAGIVGFVLALVNIFKKQPSPALVLAYAGVQGVFVGGISAWYETAFGGGIVAAGRHRHPRGRRRHARALRLGQDPRLEEGDEDLPDRHGRLPGVLARELRPHPVRRDRRPVGSARRRHLRHPARPDHRRLRRHHGGVLARARLRLHPAGRAQPRPARSTSGRGVFGIMVTVIWLYLEILRMLAIVQSSD